MATSFEYLQPSSSRWKSYDVKLYGRVWFISACSGACHCTEQTRQYFAKGELADADIVCRKSISKKKRNVHSNILKPPPMLFGQNINSIVFSALAINLKLSLVKIKRWINAKIWSFRTICANGGVLLLPSFIE